MQVDGFEQAVVVGIVILTVMGALAVSYVYPRTRAALTQMRPTRRLWTLFAWLLVPAVTGVALAVVAFAPCAVPAVAFAEHPCVSAHMLLCRLCHAAWPGGSAGMYVPAVAVTILAVRLGRLLMRAARTRRALRNLAVVTRKDVRGDLRVVESPAPISMVAGLWRPKVIVSSYLLGSLTSEMLLVVLAHERAHVRRRHGLLLLVAEILSLVHLPSARKQLLGDVALACEQICDDDAAARVGDRLTVADTIVAVRRLVSVRPPLVLLAAPAFCEHAVTVRVHHLLGEPLPRTHAAGLSWSLAAIFAAACLMVAGPVHMVIERGMLALSS